MWIVHRETGARTIGPIPVPFRIYARDITAARYGTIPRNGISQL